MEIRYLDGYYWVFTKSGSPVAGPYGSWALAHEMYPNAY